MLCCLTPRSPRFAVKSCCIALLPALIAFVQVGTALGGDRVTGATQYDERALCIAVGNMYGLDPDLLRAIAKIESNGDARARSAAGALGLMQLMPETALRFRVTDPFDPVENVLGAARFIEYLQQSHDVDGRTFELPELLAAYNAGEGAVDRYGGIPPYTETKRYVAKVLWLYLVGSTPPAPGTQHPESSHRRPERTRHDNVTKSDDASLLAKLTEIRESRNSADRPRETRCDLAKAPCEPIFSPLHD